MSGINRFLTRRDRHKKGPHQLRVMSPSVSSRLPTPVSSSASSLCTSSSAATPCPASLHQYPSSSSLSSFSLAFPSLKLKRSPRLQAVGGTVQSSTANSCDLDVLQPRQTEGHLHGLFTDFEEKLPEKTDEKTVKGIIKRLFDHGITNYKSPDIEYVLHTDYADGDVEKALDLLLLVEDSENFLVRPYDPKVKLLGAVNRRGVSCYLDATLFAIFARLDSFEAILYNTFDDEPRKRLSTLLRLWVNSLRSGKLITVDITKQLQDALANCGWPEAAEKAQQDASEAFSFITRMLNLPMLTLKMDIFHHGKEDAADDHRFVEERLLEVAIPEEPSDGRVITLEECLEMYFNSQIAVKRFLLERRNTISSMRSRFSISKGSVSHIETTELDDSRPSTPSSLTPQSSLPAYSPVQDAVERTRSQSIIQKHYIPDIPEKSEIPDLALSSDRGRSGSRPKTGTGSIRAEVMMPAWQFFSLIPWYTDTAPSSDAQVAAHFSTKRPILGICLKRYFMDKKGHACRRNTHIDIPLEIALPHFIHDDNMDEDGAAFGNFKLVLQSVVCHRGDKVSSGHYVSLVRGQAPSTSGDNSTVLDDDSFDRWMLFDDLSKERIRYVDIQKALKDESPYLLFYQVLPIDGDPGNIEQGEKPPSYISVGNESTGLDSGVAGLSLSNTDPRSSTNASTDGARVSFEEPPIGESRRPSVAFTDESLASPAARDGVATGPVSGNASLTVSRRPSQSDKRGLKSRPTSQSGESRLSASFTRLAGKLTKERPEVKVSAVDPDEEEAIAASTPSNGTETSRLKKENKEKERSRNATQQYLMKTQRKGEKPDRECVVM